MIVFNKSMWKAHRYGWARSEHLSINRFDIGHIWPVRKVRETVSDDAINLFLSFDLNTGVDGHIIEETAGHRGSLLEMHFRNPLIKGNQRLTVSVAPNK